MATSSMARSAPVSDASEPGRTLAAATARLRSAVVAAAPLVLLVGFVSHPFIGLGPPDAAAVGAAAASETTRWGVSHLIVAVGSGILLLAFLAIRTSLRESGEDQWSARAVPPIALASVLYAVLPGMEFAALAAAETGADVRAAQAAVEPWFMPVIVASGITFLLGALGFARGVARIGPVSPTFTRVVVVALVVAGLARLVPLTGVQFYVQSAALIVALWPLAYEMWRHPTLGFATRARTP
jgi:hypothetical protein